MKSELLRTTKQAGVRTIQTHTETCETNVDTIDRVPYHKAVILLVFLLLRLVLQVDVAPWKARKAHLDVVW